jgi:hypothetical protein
LSEAVDGSKHSWKKVCFRDQLNKRFNDLSISFFPFLKCTQLHPRILSSVASCFFLYITNTPFTLSSSVSPLSPSSSVSSPPIISSPLSSPLECILSCFDSAVKKAQTPKEKSASLQQFLSFFFAHFNKRVFAKQQLENEEKEMGNEERQDGWDAVEEGEKEMGGKGEREKKIWSAEEILRAKQNNLVLEILIAIASSFPFASTHSNLIPSSPSSSSTPLLPSTQANSLL